MSVVQEERNELQNRFGDKAVILIEDALYSVELLTPNERNRRLAPVHVEAIERLNSTMQRHIDGNAQIYYTMLFKDQPREGLIKQWWMKVKESPEYAKLPEPLRKLELEQAKKLGPTSRFSIEKLYDGFVSHIDEEAKVKNTHLAEYREASKYFADYIYECCELARTRYPEEWDKVVDLVVNDQALFGSLPKDKTGGDPYFIRVDRKIAGATANVLYKKLVPNAKQGLHEGEILYYEMFIRVQNKGNNLIDDSGNIVDSKEPWLKEKNRVVQGDSRTWQFMLKPISNVLTKLPKLVSANFAGWADQDRKNEIMGNTMKEFYGKYAFDSFDAEEYDASTDPENFRLGIEIIFNVFRRLFKVKLGFNTNDAIDHYLHDPTLTPWGAFMRDSTPSGHNFTGPNGTVVDMLRAYTQTRRLLNISFKELNVLLHDYDDRNIALFMSVGDDAWQLRDKSLKSEDIAAENNYDGFKNNVEKIVLAEDYIHFLQYAYFYNGSDSYMGYYPASRVVEHGLFQEHANEYSAEEVSTQAVVQNINNARFNPLQDLLIDFFYEGDPKYHLGADMGVINLFKAAAGDRTVAEFLGREWDPTYADMSWDRYSEVLADTIRKIESKGRKSA